MKLSLVIAALFGTVTVEQVMATQRHHHHHSYVQTSAEPAAAAPAAAAPAEAAADAGAQGAAADAAAAKAEVAEANPTAEQVKAEAAAVLVPKPADQSSEAQRTWAESRADDAAEAASVAKHDALGKTIFADMYAARAQGKLDSAAAAEKSANDMVEVLKARMEVNAAAEKTRQATAFKAHKAHVLHVKEHYANLEAAAAREVADAHSAWKARYNGQKRLPLDTAGETWVANMPDHVIENPDFHVKAPAPVEKVMADAAKGEAAAEAVAVEGAKPAPGATPAAPAEGAAAAPAAPAAPAAFVQLYKSRNLAQKRVAAESESESSGSESSSSSSGDSSSD